MSRLISYGIVLFASASCFSGTLRVTSQLDCKSIYLSSNEDLDIYFNGRMSGTCEIQVDAYSLNYLCVEEKEFDISSCDVTVKYFENQWSSYSPDRVSLTITEILLKVDTHTVTHSLCVTVCVSTFNNISVMSFLSFRTACPMTQQQDAKPHICCFVLWAILAGLGN